jgi:DNA-binding GntR family transcriptional regulator
LPIASCAAISAGTHLVEERRAQDFGISRAPTRESFRVLEREGLVTTSPRRRVGVRQITAEEVREIALCRAVLRGLAARLADECMTPVGLAQLEVAMTRMRASAGACDLAAFNRR